MKNRRFVLLALLELALIGFLPGLGLAQNSPLPTPRITGPTQAPDDKPLTLHFSYTPIHWSYQDKYELYYWEQYWFCKPGKDETPTYWSIRTDWLEGGFEGSKQCWLTRNNGGLSPSMTSEYIPVPKYGGVPAVPADGTWYVRVRLSWKNSKDDTTHRLGSWSLWHRVLVFTSFASKIVVKPPIVLAPKQNRIFINQGVDIEVNPTLKHTDYSRWEYVFEWKRENYNTAANIAYAKQIYLKTHANTHAYFSHTLGRNSSLQPWLSPARLRAMPENSGTTGGFQVVGSKLPTMSAHLNFSTLRSKRKDSSYLYKFRVREHIRNSKAYGPWSPWRGFIVQERTESPPLKLVGHKGMVFSGLSHISLPKSSGHKGTGLSRPFHLSSLAKPKLTIQYAIASSTNACDANRLLRMNVIIRNEGVVPLSAHTRFAYVHAVESGGAHLTSPKVSLPAIPARKTWRGVLVIGAGKSFFPKLPGRHTLLVSIGPDHAAPGTLAYIPPPPFRATVNFPAGYCQQPHYHGIGVLMRGATRGAVHGTTRGKLTASPRHAAQQRGVQKKLTPVAPALRLAPAAPAHRLNLPMQLRLNR